MGKERRRAERAARRQFRRDGSLEKAAALLAADPEPEPDRAELKSRPEYIANMQAWREAGCPGNG